MKFRKMVLVLSLIVFPPMLMAEDYLIDTKGSHASINFKIPHLGYSWLVGRFNEFGGSFSYEEKNPSAAKVEVTIETNSVDSNHAERDIHLRGKDFLYAKKYPQAKFVSTSFESRGDDRFFMKGDFTLRGVTQEIEIEVSMIGAGTDPWGGFRRGFSGATQIALEDFGILKDLGPASKTVDLILHVEGIRQ